MNSMIKYIQTWNPSAIDNAALSFGSVSFSLLAVGLLPELKTISQRNAWAVMLSVIISAIALGFLVRIIQRLLLNFWARPILGSWVYESSSGNWGLARIRFTGNVLKYNVDLYPDEKSVRAAGSNEYRFGEKVLASVESLAVEYEQGKVSLIYIIDETDATKYAPREGILKLVTLPGDTAMKGYWKSDIEGSSPKSGILNLVRLEQFLAMQDGRLLEEPEQGSADQL